MSYQKQKWCSGLFVSTTSGVSDVKREAKTETDSKEKTEERDSQMSLFYCVCVRAYV